MVAIFAAEVEESSTQAANTTFRRGYGEHAIGIAKKIKNASATATVEILETAKSILEMKERLNAREFAAFIAEMLCWTRTEARKYLDIGRVFGNFDCKAIAAIEPFLLNKLCAKRFAPVVEALRVESDANPIRVQELIKKLIPKPTVKKKDVLNYGDAMLQKHPNAKDGDFYYTLRSVNLNGETGAWLEEKMHDRTVAQVLAEARQREINSEYTAARLAEFEQGIPELRDRYIQAEKELLGTKAENEQLKKEIAALRSAQVKPLSNVEPPTRMPVPEEPPVVLMPSCEPEKTIEPTQEPEAIVPDFVDWSEVAKAAECDRNQFHKLAKACSESERKHILNLLSNFLETDSLALDQVSWVPENLLKSALARLCFSVQQIVGGDSPNEDPRVEMVSGCTLANIQNFGNRRECWIFELPNGKRVPIFGRGEFLVEAF